MIEINELDTMERETFLCTRCQTEKPWSCGQDDDFFELCDDCWYKQEGGKEEKPLTPKQLAINKKLKAWADANNEHNTQFVAEGLTLEPTLSPEAEERQIFGT